jgi:hypothetical protein
LGRDNINANAFGNACSKITVYLVPELERTLLHGAFDTLAQMPSDVAGQMFAVCLGKDVPVEITRLYKVVILRTSQGNYSGHRLNPVYKQLQISCEKPFAYLTISAL